MDINKLKKVRNTLRLQFDGGVPKYLNINQQCLPIKPRDLNNVFIIDEKPTFQNVENPKQVETMPKVNKINITMPEIDTETLDKHQKELDKDLTTWEKIRSGRLDYKKLKEEQEKDPEEYEKQYGELNKSLNKTVSTIGTVVQGIGQAVSANQMMTDSNLTKGIDVGYDLVADGLSKAGPAGQVVGTAMKVLETIGDIGQEYLGTGTDQQSTLDKWMDSPLFSWNVGMLNGAAGKNTDSFTINQDMISQIGGSYGGSVNSLNEAAKKADKEYGLFSWKSREKANADIASAKYTQNVMNNISDTASDQRLAVQSMGEQAGLAYSMMTNGGYNQKYTYSAKEGGRLIPKCQKGSHAVFSHIVYDNPEVKKYVEPIIQIIDPTGISSYRDAYEAVKQVTEDPNLKTFSNAALNVIGALPVIGKVTTGIKLGKATKATQALTNTTKNVNKVIDTVPELIPGVKQIAEQVQDLTSEYVVNPLFKKFVTKYDPNNMQDKVNTFINVVNGGNTTGDIVNAVQTYTETESKKKTTNDRPGKGIGFPSEKEGGILEWHPDIELNWELPEFQKGGKVRSINELIEYAKQQNPRFIQRLSEEPKGIKFIDDEGNDTEGSHYLESRGKYVIPRIQEINGELKFLNPQEAIDRAMESGNYLEMDPEEAILFAEQYKQGWPDFFKKFKKGGSIGNSDIPEIEETTQKNVIPEGALHKNKHHMEHAEGLTKKGIPVIDDDGEQQAEIEHSEIIFTLEVTKKLEEYYQIFYSEESSNKEKEQAAIDAGKLLVYQILENTDDRTNLIESCKDGGTLKLKKSTDDLIEEALEWIPQIVIIEEEIKEEQKDKKKSEKEQMKEIIKEAIVELLIK